VELFQSQGCSDCPPAQEYLNRLSERSDVLALSYGVTYWDYLGWKDSFASPQFTQRQRGYSTRNRGVGVATPQYWINGQVTVLGANPVRVAQLVDLGTRATAGQIITIEFAASGKSEGTTQVPKLVKTDAEWRAQLSPLAFQVARQAGTEYAFSGEYDKFDGDGVFDVCAVAQRSLTRRPSSNQAPAGRASFAPYLITT
jgi:hypothetical protein